jgi:hypothetical protein
MNIDYVNLRKLDKVTVMDALDDNRINMVINAKCDRRSCRIR